MVTSSNLPSCNTRAENRIATHREDVLLVMARLVATVLCGVLILLSSVAAEWDHESSSLHPRDEVHGNDCAKNKRS